MQARKAEKQPPTHSTGDTVHADSTAVCTQRCPHQCKRDGDGIYGTYERWFAACPCADLLSGDPMSWCPQYILYECIRITLK
jgi:hypothetical protein